MLFEHFLYLLDFMLLLWHNVGSMRNAKKDFGEKAFLVVMSLTIYLG